MEHAAVVGKLERSGQGDHEPGDVVVFPGEGGLPAGEAAAGGQLHGEPGKAAVIAKFIQGQDGRVLEHGEGAGLQVKAGVEFIRIAAGAGLEHFQGYVPGGGLLPRVPDDAHAAAAHFFHQRAAAHLLALQKR